MELIVSYLITNGVKYVEFCYANIFPANPFNVTIKIPLERFNTTLDFAVHNSGMISHFKLTSVPTCKFSLSTYRINILSHNICLVTLVCLLLDLKCHIDINIHFLHHIIRKYTVSYRQQISFLKSHSYFTHICFLRKSNRLFFVSHSILD